MDGFHDKRALVVDDQRTITTLLSAMLQRLGFLEVAVAHDGEEALSKLHDQPFDLLVSDIAMEPMGGLVLARKVREDPALRELPVILTTASRDTANVVAAKRLGVNEFLVKPFTPAALEERLARLPGFR